MSFMEQAPIASQARHNHVLAAMPAAALARLESELELVSLPQGRLLCEPDEIPTHVYFPTTAILSLLYVDRRGASTEIALIGRDGVLGIELFLGGGTTPNRAAVQLAGASYRLPASRIVEEFNDSRVRQLLLRYTQALITQMAQTAVCNRHHSLEQRLSRWLLMSLDRANGCELETTQESIASLLGVRREGVTEVAIKLQRAGLIGKTRGHITVLDRAGLERTACECYAAVKRETERLLPTPPA